jgi:hypothetical protein
MKTETSKLLKQNVVPLFGRIVPMRPCACEMENAAKVRFGD